MKRTHQDFLDKVHLFSRKWLKVKFLSAFFSTLFLLAILWISATIADQIFYFSKTTRWGLFVLNSVIVIVFFAFAFKEPIRYWIRVRGESGLHTKAGNLSIFYPDANDGFIIACQLISRDRLEYGSSAGLREAAVDEFVTRYSKENFSSQISFKLNWMPAKIYVPVLLAIIFLFSIQKEAIIHSTYRLLNPSNDYISIPKYNYTVVPGNVKIFRGQSLAIKADYTGPILENCILVRFDQDEVLDNTLVLTGTGYEVELKNIRENFSYQLSGLALNNKSLSGRLLSEVYRVTVIDPPDIETMDIRIEPPEYTGLAGYQIERNVGDFAALIGSRVEIDIKVNKPLAKGFLKFGSGQTVPLKLQDRLLRGWFSISKDDVYKIILQDTSDYQNQNPISYQISAIQDNAPYVDITDPGRDVDSPIDGGIELKIMAEDDYGIDKLNLYYQIRNGDVGIIDSTWTLSPIKFSPQRSVLTFFSWDFNKLPLTFSDTLKYFATTSDNNIISGPSSAQSRVYSIRFPSLEELFEAADKQQENQISTLEKIKKESEKIKEDLDKIERQINREKKLDWEKKQSIEKSIQRQQELQKKLETVRQNLEEAIQKLDRNNLIDSEVLEKYNKLQQLFREVLSPELANALQELQKSLENPDIAEVQKALRQFKLNQAAFEKNIERTTELLKRVQFEQHLDRLVKQSQKMSEQQKKISEQIQKKLSEPELPGQKIAQMQKQQQEQLENFNQDLDQFSQQDLLEQFKKAQEKIDSVKALLKDQQPNVKMDKNIEQLSAGQMQKSSQSSQQLENTFAGMQQLMQQAQKSMLSQGKKNIAKKMQQISNQMLNLSMVQEQIHNKTKGISALGNNFNPILKQQGQTLGNFNKIVKEVVSLSKETFFIQPSLASSLSKTGRNMQQSLGQLSERNKSSALQSQGNAMTTLNEGVLSLRQSMSQMMQSQSGTGFEQFLKQMQEMAGKQGQVNSESMNLFQMQGNRGKLSMQQQGQFNRLGARQAAIRQAMEELSRQTGNRDDLLGDLNQMSKEMENVENDLLRRNLNRTTIERQQQILSRMLESQRSLETREYSDKRKAEQSKAYLIQDPGEQGITIRADKKMIEEAMRAALKQGFNKDYQKMIKIYFEKLLRNTDQEQQTENH